MSRHGVDHGVSVHDQTMGSESMPVDHGVRVHERESMNVHEALVDYAPGRRGSRHRASRTTPAVSRARRYSTIMRNGTGPNAALTTSRISCVECAPFTRFSVS